MRKLRLTHLGRNVISHSILYKSLLGLFLLTGITSSSIHWMNSFEEGTNISIFPPGPCPITNAIGGTVFRDLDFDGLADDGDPSDHTGGWDSIYVYLYDCTGILDSTVSDSNGDYFFDISGYALGTDYRIEFHIKSNRSFLAFSPAGGDGGTDIQLVNGAYCGVNIGAGDVAAYCQTNPFLLTPCYVDGGADPTMDVVVRWTYLNEGTAPLDKTGITQVSMAGSLWGLAYSKSEKLAYSSAVLKRHIALGPEGLDAIYTIDPFSGSPNATPWLELTDDLGIAVSPYSAEPQYLDNITRDVITAAQNDPSTFVDVGKMGMGDIELSADEQTLYIVNLFDKSLYAIDIVTKTVVPGFPLSIPDPGCIEGEMRPWALAQDEGKIYVGVICDGSTAGTNPADLTDLTGLDRLSATVYRLDGSTFTSVLSFPLDYRREEPFHYTGKCNQIFYWKPWNDVLPDVCEDGNIAYPSPILTDIEFDDDKNMILGFTDRTGYQIGNNNYGPTGTTLYAMYSGGEILKACKSGSIWEIESMTCTNSEGDYLESADIYGTTFGTIPKIGEFYQGDYFHGDGNIDGTGLSYYPGHAEIATGGLAVVPLTGEVVTTTYDPVTGAPNYVTGGVIALSNTTGKRTRNGFELYDSNDDGTITAGKGIGLGDLEALCDPAPIQIVTSVWYDINGDGIQGSCEVPIENVPVSLYDPNDLSSPIVTKLSDADGNTTFSTLEISAGEEYYLSYGNSQSISIGGLNFEATLVDVGEGVNPDQNDSDVSSFPMLLNGAPSVLFEAPIGGSNFTLDAGFVLPPPSLGDTVFVDANYNGLQDMGEMPIEGVAVSLFDANTGLQVTTDANGNPLNIVTDANGYYKFENIPVGSYFVEFDVATATNVDGTLYYPTIENANGGSLDPVDSDINALQRSDTTTLAGGQMDCTLDAGYFVPAKIGDTVWVDANKNGIYDVGESGIAGVKVSIFNGDGSPVTQGANGAYNNMITTGPDGMYMFGDLLPGDYYLVFDISMLGGGYVFTQEGQGMEFQDSDVPAGPGMMGTGQTTITTLVSGSEVLDVDAGLVLCDLVVTLDPAMDECLNMPQAPTTITATPSGGFGVYSYEWSTTETTASIAPAPTVTTLYSVTVTDELGCTATAEVSLIECSSIGDKVFFDQDQDGLQGPDEPGVPGVMVFILDKDMNRIPDPMNQAIDWKVTTDANGMYIFDNINVDIDNDTFFIEFMLDPLAGYLPSPIQDPDVNSGGAMDTETDSDIDLGAPTATGYKTGEIILFMDTVFTNVDAGIIGNDTLGDYVFVDNNGDGVQNAGDDPLPGVKVYLKVNGVIVDSTTTGMMGEYEFVDLIPNPQMEYSVQFVAPTGYYVTGFNDPNGLGDDTDDSDADPAMMLMTEPYVFTGADEYNPDFDAGFFLPVAIGDTAFIDVNYNGLQDMGEPGIERVQVTLYNADESPVTMDLLGNPVQPIFTNADGYYKFENLPPGDYYTLFDVTTAVNGGAYVATTENVLGTSLESNDSDINAVGISDTATVVSGGMDCTLDAGYFLPVSVGDTVFVDVNYNGIQDAGEVGIPGVTVSIFFDDGTPVTTDADGNPLMPAVTDALGRYKFDNLTPGSYYVIFDESTATDGNGGNYVPTLENINGGSLDPIDSDINQDQISDTTGFILSGGMDCTLDAGYVVPVSVGDTVFVDLNGNGLQDPMEPGIVDVPVTLFDAVTGNPVTADINGNPIPLVTTNTNGYYKFTDLAPGSYYVVFDVASSTDPDAANYVPTMENVNGASLDPVDSDINMLQVSDTTLVLTSGDMDCTLDAGYFVPVVVGDTVWVDANGDGLQDAGEPGIPGVEVTLWKIINGMGVEQTQDYFGNPFGTVVTDANGYYVFDSLMPGEYYVEFDVTTATDGNGADYVATLDNVNGSNQPDDNDVPLGGTFSDTTAFLESGGQDVSLDAGYFVPVSVGDTVFVDANGNGLQDMGESPIPGVSVSLYKVENGVGVLQTTDYLGNDISMMVTNANGYYKFENLIPGQYYVIFDESTATDGNGGNYLVTIENVNGTSNDPVDSDINMAQESDTTMMLISGEMDCTLDAGYFLPVSIGDTVWVDNNGNGIQDPIESGIPNVKVSLYKVVSGVGVLQTMDYLGSDLTNIVTDANGYYKFDTLAPGQYYVEFDVDNAGNGTDFYPTYDHISGGSNDPLDSDIEADMLSDTSAVLASGEMDCTLDAGYFSPIAIGDTAWVDANLDGLQDPGEPGLSGIIVTLYYYNPDSMAFVEETSDLDGNLIDPDTTDAQGRYKFENLPPGEYYVEFNSNGIPTTLEDVGMDDALDSDINDMGLSDTLLVLSTDTMNCTFDAGYQGLDYGDLPDSYVTTDANNGGDAPKHVLREYKYLGSQIDQDVDGVPGTEGIGDDTTSSAYILPIGAMGPDDEDGIEFLSPMIPGNVAYIKVTYTVDNPATEAFLNAWIDFDGSGAFETGDALEFVNVDGTDITPTTNLTLAGGTDVMIIVAFNVPETAVFAAGGVANARFRMSCDGNLAPDSGLALDGEIEDYVVPVAKIGNLVWLDEDYNGLQDTTSADPEPGIADAEIVLRYLYDDPNRSISLTIIDTVVTDASGVYSFCGLIADDIGKYELISITPEGMIATLDNVGTDEDLDSDGDNFFDLGKDSVTIDPFMIMAPIDLPQAEDGLEDAPNVEGVFVDSLFNQQYDFGYVPQDFGDLPEMDFGDLPLSYNTSEAGSANPPRHIVTENKRLGMCIDSEPDGQPDLMGMGDDNNMDDTAEEFSFGDCSAGTDEDGIEYLTPLFPGDTAYMKITYTLPVMPGSDTAGYVNGWIDFDSTGNFNTGDELMFFSVDGVVLPAPTSNLALETGSDTMIIAGFLVPVGAVFHNGSIYSRFRLTCEGGLDPIDNPLLRPLEGEVEDYVVPLGKVGNLVWLDANYDGIQDGVGTADEEEGIADVLVEITFEIEDPVNGGTLIVNDTTLTDEDGIYYFCGLVPSDLGSYKLTVISPEDLTPTFANAAPTDSLDSDNDMVMGDTIVMTDPFMVTAPIMMPTGEDGIGDDPNEPIGTFVDSLVNQTYDFGFTPLDYGDLDSTYVTLKPDGGAVHVIVENKYLGAGVDAEIDATVDSLAGAIVSGDDNTGSAYKVPEDALFRDDEDGITWLTPLIPGYKATIQVDYTIEGEDGVLNAWIDWDGNGMMDPSDQITFYTDMLAATTDAPLAEGSAQSIELCLDVPADAIFSGGSVFARFRMSCDGGLDPTGGNPGGAPGAPPGEVEDYYVPLAKVGNLSWYDDNLNGKQDSTDVVPAELGVADTRVILRYAGYQSSTFGNDDDLTYEVTTDADGLYTFCGLIEGTYDLLPAKYIEDAVTPEDTIPERYILTVADCSDQATEDDIDSDFIPAKLFTIPSLLTDSLVNALDADPQNEEGFLDGMTDVGTFPDWQTDLTFDMGWIPEPNIEAVLTIPGVQPPASNTCGNFNVILDLCMKNTGFVDKEGVLVGAPFDGLSAIIDMDSLLGDAFVSIVGIPEVLDSLEYNDGIPLNVPSELPTASVTYDGDGQTNMLNIDGVLLPDEEICVRVIVEVAPNQLDMMEALALAFSAEVQGKAVNYEGKPIPDFFNGGAQYIAVDTSDMNFDFVGGYEDPNEPTPLGDCWKTTRELTQIAQLNMSVDENCELMFTASSLLTDHNPDCDKEAFPLGGYYIIDVEAEDGVSLPGLPVYDESMIVLDGNPLIGEDLKISVSSVSEHCNSIWGIGTVEDKIVPQIICMNDTISCTASLDEAILPEVIDNCGGAERIMINEVHEVLTCDPDFSGTVTRTWMAVDVYGNESEPCVQVIYLERTDLGAIVWPQNKLRTTNSQLICGVNDDIDPSNTGVPTLNGVPLYPFAAAAICNGFIEYHDQPMSPTTCLKTIRRTWTIGEWWCSQTVEKTWVQFIEIEDTIAPVILDCPSDMTVNTQSRSCTGLVDLPAISVEDGCGSPFEVRIQYPDNTLLSNGGTIELPAGTHTVTYEVEDDCFNTSSCSIQVTVVDEKNPIIICERDLQISLSGNGTATLDAYKLDDGSFDECTDLTYEARRMTDACGLSGTDWTDRIEFCCEDAGTTVMVALMVTDEGGNTNVCMVEVDVVDKIPPRMTCLDNETVDCTENFDLDSLVNRFGLPTIIDNCPAANTIEERHTENINQCGIGHIYRYFDLIDALGNVVQTCTQVITVEGDTQLDELMIEWPGDLDTMNLCLEGGDLLPDNLPVGYQEPSIPEGFCNLIGVKYEDEIYDASEGAHACFKIIRTWKVIDWCNRMEGLQDVFPTYEWEQIIKVENNTAPTIISACVDIVIETYRADCGPAFVSLEFAATDDCTPADDLIITYELDVDDDGIIEDAGSGVTTVTDSFAIGVHRISWEVEDRCGNVSSCSYTFEVRNLKPPTPICLDGVSLDLVAMDTDEEVGNDTAMAILTVEQIDAKSYHPCGYDITLSFSADVEDDTLIFDCSHVGEQWVELWVTDENGNQSFCSTTVLVTSAKDGGFCDGDPNGFVVVGGEVSTQSAQMIERVTVELKGSELAYQLTEADGIYTFSDMSKGGNYEIIPKKDDEPLNGVSTLDLVLIQRHVLGVEEITSPYLLLAADINRDGKVSATDLIELRKVILGHYETFPKNTSWRFVDARYEFYDMQNPWDEDAPETYLISQLSNDMKVDWIGYKVGDVSGNAEVNSRESVETRSLEEWAMQITDQYVERGEVMDIAVNARDLDEVYGLQFDLLTEGLDVIDVFNASIQLEATQIWTGDDEVRMSIHAHKSLGDRLEDNIITIQVRARRSGMLSEMVSLNTSRINAESYIGEDLDVNQLIIEWLDDSINDGAMVLAQNVPNPWSTKTEISFEIPTDGETILLIRDITGKLIRRIEMDLQAGKHKYEIRDGDFPEAGVLMYDLIHGDQMISKRMIRLR